MFANGEYGYLGGLGRELSGGEQFSNNLQEFIAFSETNQNSSSFMPGLTDPSIGDLSIPDDIANPALYLVPMLTEVPFDILGIERRADGTFFGAYEGPEVIYETGKIQGFVRDAVTNLSIADAQVTATNNDNGALAIATPFGSHYSMLLPAGNYNVTCSAEGYQTSEAVQIVVEVGQNAEHTFYLQPGEDETLTGLRADEITTFRIFPNPANDHFLITNAEAANIRITNQSGLLMMETEISSKEQTIDISRLPAGLYFVFIKTETGTDIQKLVIK